MLTEIINDKKFRIFFIVLVVGIMLTVISVPDAISLLKPAKDISQLWVTDPSILKTGDHVCLDISLISDSPFSNIETTQVYGITTSERETARYYYIPFIRSNATQVYANSFVVAKIAASYNSAMTKQVDASNAWWDDPDADFDDIPTTSFHFDGILQKMPKNLKTEIDNTLPAGVHVEPFLFEPIAHPEAAYVLSGVGLLCVIVSIIVLVTVVKTAKQTPALAPTTGNSNHEYYGPQGADQPYQSGYSTTARKANISNNSPTIKDMVGGAFASSGTPSVSGTLPPTTPATPFGSQTGPQGAEPVLSSLKQRQPVMPEAQPYVSPFAATTPAGADASANPLYGGGAAPTTPTEYVSPLANQSGNLNYNPAYGQAPGENYAAAPTQELTADALAANSRFLGGMNMDPMLAQTAPIAPPTNPLETPENQQGPAGGLNPALTGQRVQPSPYTQPQTTPYAAQQAAPAPYTQAQPAPYSPQPAPYTPPQPAPYSPQPAPYTPPQPAPTNYNGQNV
ncbi:MAG: hypothetical protein IKH46_09210 [Lachnospiraceae bacterium]|nr:hypothetical protein [Lachnospiraceae bacterium]